MGTPGVDACCRPRDLRDRERGIHVLDGALLHAARTDEDRRQPRVPGAQQHPRRDSEHLDHSALARSVDSPVVGDGRHPHLRHDRASLATANPHRLARGGFDGSARPLRRISARQPCGLAASCRDPRAAQLLVRDRRHAAVPGPLSPWSAVEGSAGTRQLPVDRVARARRHGRGVAGPPSVPCSSRRDQTRAS